MRKSVHSMQAVVFLFILVVFSACSGGSQKFSVPDGNQPLMQLTGAMATMSSGGDMTGKLFVYDTTNGKLLVTENLTINDSGVSSPVFDLTRSTEYRFVVIFYWQGVAMAYVDTMQTTANDETTNIRFTADMIVYTSTNSSEDPNLSADISDGILPDLNPDGDAYDTFTELQAGTDPIDGDSVPTGPDITFAEPIFSNDGNTLTISVTIHDGTGIVSATPGFTGADYLKAVLENETITKDTDNKNWTYSATFNPQYAPVGDLEINFTAADTLNLSNTRSKIVPITDNGENVGPIIDFESLSKDDILNGIVTLALRAYDRDGVSSVIVNNPLSGLTTTPTTLDRFIANWDTTSADEGPYAISATATDAQGEPTTTTLSVTISNTDGRDKLGPNLGLEIYKTTDTSYLFHYESGAEVYGNLKLYAHADDVHGVDTLALFNDTNFEDGLGTPTSSSGHTVYNNTLDTTQLSDGEWQLEFRATDDLGNISKRTFSITVANHPVINSFTANGATNETILSGTSVNFAWDITHSGDDDIDTVTITDPNGNTIFSGLGSAVSTDFIPTIKGTYQLTATRNPNKSSFADTEEITILFYGADADDDTLLNESDNCPLISNLDQADLDGDHVGDVCDTDIDGDTVANAQDSFPNDPTETIDTDHDGVGNNTDPDIDNDGTDNTHDAFPNDPTETLDTDGDSIGNNADLCDTISNPNNMDTDGDLQGDVCDDDADNDGFSNTYETVTSHTDPLDADSDNDGVLDSSDVFPLDATETIDADHDGVGDNADCDDVNADRYPGHTEVPYDGIDQDCTGTDLTDEDGDGHGATVTGGDDCDDTNRFVYPNADEVLDGEDNDCDGITDMFSLSFADSKFIGDNMYDNAGDSISITGDVNGDGKDDILIGAHYKENGGSSYLIYGSDNLDGNIDLSRADVIFNAENTGDHAGSSVAIVGDINGDGYDDILIGAYLEDSGGTDSGAAYLIYGSNNLSGVFDLSTADVKFIGEALGDKAGTEVSGAGDVNNDGYDDILMGVPFVDDSSRGSNAGAVYIIYGGNLSGSIDLSDTDVKLIDKLRGTQLGVHVSNAGDVNRDGYDDILIGSNGSSRAVYLVYGSNNLLGEVDLSILDATASAQFIPGSFTPTYLVSSAGDVNRDGYSDILIGSYFNDTNGTNDGAVCLFYGGAGATLLQGTPSLSDADVKFIGENSNDNAGRSISSAGDMNGDGYSDILIGAYGEDSGGSNAGATYLIYGGDGINLLSGNFNLSTADAKFTGEHVDDYIGVSLSGTGDVNGDGQDDILIGTDSEDTGGTLAGAAYLILSHFGE